MAVDVEQRGAVFLDVDGVVIPEFVVERLGHDAVADRPSHAWAQRRESALVCRGNCFPDAFAGKRLFCCFSGEAAIA
jgi:hypothetical protein